MTFAISLILIPYLAVVLFVGLFYFFNVFHLLRYAIKETSTYMLLVVYTLPLLVILGLSATMLASYNWSYQASTDEILPFNSNAVNTFGL